MNADRQILKVPALGLSEHCVMQALNVTWSQLQPLYGRTIGAPRDYAYRRNGAVFTAEGVRRLVEHFQRAVDVIGEATPATTAEAVAAPVVAEEKLESTTNVGTCRTTGRRTMRGPWWEDHA